MNPGPEAFELDTVVHLVSPAGVSARNLEELRAAIARAPERSLFWHVAGGQRREPWSEELPPDDFSAWVGGVVQDRETAERMSFAVQSHRGEPGALRAALLEALDGVGTRQRETRSAPEGGEFALLTFDSVTVPTGLTARDPDALVNVLAQADAGAWRRAEIGRVRCLFDEEGQRGCPSCFSAETRMPEPGLAAGQGLSGESRGCFAATEDPV
jgi:hypothetical protein